jgi:hypothetical protein
VPQGSVLGPFLFNLFINDLCSTVQYCKILIFADDVKIFRVINSPHDCLLLQSDINSVSDWCFANSMRLNTAKTRVMSYTRKTNFLSYNYQLCRATITRTSSIRDLGVFFDSKLNFHNHVDYVFSEWGRRIGLTTLPPSVSRLSRQCGILNISQPYRPPRPVRGMALSYSINESVLKTSVIYD